MDNKEIIKSFAFDCNELLTGLININDKYIKETGTFASLFRKIDFHIYYIKTKEVYEKIIIKLREIIDYKNSNINNLSDDLSAFLACLIEFLIAIEKSAGILHKNISHLHEKSQGTGKFSLWQQFKESRELNNSIKGYHKIGIKLNKYYEEIFG